MTQNLVPQKTDVDIVVWVQNLMWNHFGTLLLKHMFVWPPVPWSCCKLARIRPQWLVKCKGPFKLRLPWIFPGFNGKSFSVTQKNGSKNAPCMARCWSAEAITFWGGFHLDKIKTRLMTETHHIWKYFSRVRGQRTMNFGSRFRRRWRSSHLVDLTKMLKPSARMTSLSKFHPYSLPLWWLVRNWTHWKLSVAFE